MTVGCSSLTWQSLIVLWGWVSLHTCCTLSNQCAQVKPAVSTRTWDISWMVAEHPCHQTLAINQILCPWSGGAQNKSPRWSSAWTFATVSLPILTSSLPLFPCRVCYILFVFSMPVHGTEIEFSLLKPFCHIPRVSAFGSCPF